MYYIAACVLIFIIQPIKAMDMMTKSSDNYGIFNLKLMEVEICRGPKLINLAEVDCNINKNADDVFIGTFDFNISDTFKFEEIKITLYNKKKGKKVLLWNYRINDPCKHFAIGPYIKFHFKTENCVIKKGRYYYEINIDEIVHKFFGDSFFFGDYIMKVIWQSKKGNFACMICHAVFEKSGN